MKKITGIMICLLICTFFVMGSMAVWADQTGAVSGQPRVFDQAGLFSETEIIQLEEKIAQCRKSTKMDVVIVSAYADGERSAEEYADDYYDYGGKESQRCTAFILYGRTWTAGGRMLYFDCRYNDQYAYR